MAAWRLKATGKLFHSGLAHKVTTTAGPTACSVLIGVIVLKGMRMVNIKQVFGAVEGAANNL